MRRFSGLLAIFAILFSLAKANADTLTHYLNFQSLNQSLWHAGVNVSTTFDLTGKTKKIKFDEQARTSIRGVGTFSAGADGNVGAGRAGLELIAYANGGTVDINYPMTLVLNYPDPATLRPGQTFTLSSSWSPGASNQSPALVTRSPEFGAKIRGVISAPDAYLRISLRAFGEWLRFRIFNEDIFANEELYDTKNLQPGSTDILDGVLAVNYVQPTLNLTARRSGNDLVAEGYTRNADRSGMGFVTLTGNFTNALGYVAGTALGGEPIKFSDSIDESFLDCGFRGAYDILALIGAAGIGLREEIRFRPSPEITLVVNEGNGNNRRVVKFRAGESVRLTMPADNTGLFLSPSVSLDHTFSHQLSASASADLTFWPFSIYCALRLIGYNLADFSYYVPSYKLVSVGGRVADLYKRNFKLGGFETLFLPEIAIGGITPPPPPTLLAQDHFYTARLQADSTGSYFYLYVAPAQGALSGAEGPSSLQAVPQNWVPDPMNPNLFFRLTAAGAIELKFPAGNGVGQLHFPYQITDGSGNFASGNIYITLPIEGGGGG